ncbi:MAG: cupredoxin domain-containing protein [Mycobacteriales bacterium]
MTRTRIPIVAIAVLAAVACSSSDKKSSTSSGTGSGSGSTVKESSSAAVVADVSYVVGAVDYKYELPANLAIKAGQQVNITLENNGKNNHELEVFDPSGKALGEIEPIAAGKKDAATFDFPTAGTYKFVCGVDDHEARGMVSTVTVS